MYPNWEKYIKGIARTGADRPLMLADSLPAAAIGRGGLARRGKGRVAQNIPFGILDSSSIKDVRILLSL
jgi:hypothetical protein